jgi:hypothetical protein
MQTQHLSSKRNAKKKKMYHARVDPLSIHEAEKRQQTTKLDEAKS